MGRKGRMRFCYFAVYICYFIKSLVQCNKATFHAYEICLVLPLARFDNFSSSIASNFLIANEVFYSRLDKVLLTIIL